MAKRGRKRKNKRYFEEEQEQAVISYLNTDNSQEKNKIYEEMLRFPLYKMAESIINKYQYYSHKLTFDELMYDTLSDLHTKIDKFHPIKSANDRIYKIITEEFNENYTGDFVAYMPIDSIDCTTEDIQEFITTIEKSVSEKCLLKLRTLTKTKAFSYFGTIIKHYILGKRIKEQKEIHRLDSYETQAEYLAEDENLSYQITPEDSVMQDFFYEYIRIIEKVLEDNEEEGFLRPNEEKMGYAIIHLMKNWETVFDDGGHKYNKNQVLECLRNMTNLTTKDIRDNLKRFRTIYYDEKQAKINSEYNYRYDEGTKKSKQNTKNKL
jgi:hypothetical protein